MIVLDELMIENFGPIARFDHKFNHSFQTITGMNGIGKSHVLNLIATLAGTDAATDLCVGLKIGRVYIHLLDNHTGERFSLTIENEIDRETIEEFKSLLGTRRFNYGLPQDRSVKYAHGCCNYASLKRDIVHLLRNSGTYPRITTGQRAAIYMGSGLSQMIKLYHILNIENQPLMLDFPEIHLDSRAQSEIRIIISIRPQQIICVTHSPELSGMIPINMDSK